MYDPQLIGKMITLKTGSYPQYKGKIGVITRIIDKVYPDGGFSGYEVMIDGNIHPYTVSWKDIQLA